MHQIGWLLIYELEFGCFSSAWPRFSKVVSPSRYVSDVGICFFHLNPCLSVSACIHICMCPVLWSIELCDEGVEVVGGADGVSRPEDSQPVHDSHSASQQLFFPVFSPLSLLSGPESTRQQVCVCVSMCDCRRQQKMQTELSVCMCLFLWPCACVCLYFCMCVWVWKWLSRRSCWHPFEHWFTTAETHKSLLSAALILSYSLCHSHSTCCHLAQLLMNLYTRRKWI